jgi:hypothetical protein
MTISLQTLARALGGEISNGEVLAPGPGHSPRDRSLSIRPEPGAPDGFLVHSFADDDSLVCRVCRDYVRNRLGLDPFKPNGGAKPNSAKAAKQLVRTFTYEYRDQASGEVRYRKIRREYDDGTKSFVIEPKNRGGNPPLLYGGERLADLAEGQPVWIVEGEKKVEALKAHGAVAVSGDTGSQSKWLPEHAGLLRGHTVIFWPDSDEPGVHRTRGGCDPRGKSQGRSSRSAAVPNGHERGKGSRCLRLGWRCGRTRRACRARGAI